MNRPAGARPRRRSWRRRSREEPDLARRRAARCGARSRPRTSRRHAHCCPSSRRELEAAQLTPARGAPRSAPCATSKRRPAPTRTGGSPRGSASLVILAGPVANILVAFVIFFAVYATGAPSRTRARRWGRSRRTRPPPRPGSQVGRPHRRRRRTRRDDLRSRLAADPREPRQADHGHGRSRRQRRHARPARRPTRSGGRWICGFVPTAQSSCATRSATARGSRAATPGRSSRAPCRPSGAISSHEGPQAAHEHRRHRPHLAAGAARSSFNYYLQIARLRQHVARAPEPAAAAAARRRPHPLLDDRGDPRAARSRGRSTSGSPSIGFALILICSSSRSRTTSRRAYRH